MGEEIFSDADIANIRLLDNPRFCGQVSTIVVPGKIARIEGVEAMHTMLFDLERMNWQI